MADPTVILTDVEGTTTPIAFVRDVLFPFARARLADFLATHQTDAEVAPILAEIGQCAPGETPLAALLGWMDADAKVTPLKSLQGLIWRAGYETGAIKGAIYPDVPAVLRGWAAMGRRIAIYSSGSVEAQRLIFRHSDAGDLSGLIAGYFDTMIGAKREAASYRRIAEALAVAPGDILFLSDVVAELDAAAGAGLRTCQLVRPQDGTQPGTTHRVATDFTQVR
jgi:enolase-phosphatase E1